MGEGYWGRAVASGTLQCCPAPRRSSKPSGWRAAWPRGARVPCRQVWAHRVRWMGWAPTEAQLLPPKLPPQSPCCLDALAPAALAWLSGLSPVPVGGGTGNPLEGRVLPKGARGAVLSGPPSALTASPGLSARQQGPRTQLSAEPRACRVGGAGCQGLSAASGWASFAKVTCVLAGAACSARWLLASCPASVRGARRARLVEAAERAFSRAGGQSDAHLPAASASPGEVCSRLAMAESLTPTLARCPVQLQARALQAAYVLDPGPKDPRPLLLTTGPGAWGLPGLGLGGAAEGTPGLRLMSEGCMLSL